jgi:hypothetical protein
MKLQNRQERSLEEQNLTSLRETCQESQTVFTKGYQGKPEQ